ncbi:MAG: WD40 repeat domain-containing protein, partial [Anaerolineae bacterium]|nr:WD40 repeat domain-containing protein [Anaerolineae bacterium]
MRCKRGLFLLLALLLAACGQIDQAGVVLVGPALSPAPPTATPRPVIPSAVPVAFPLPAPIPADRAPLTPGNAAALQELAALPGAIGPFMRLAFDQDGSRLAAADDRGFVQLWNLPENTVQIMTAAAEGITPTPFSLRSSPPGRVPYGALVFNPAADRVFALGEDYVRTWSVADNRLLAVGRLPAGGSFNPNGSVALHSGEDTLLMARGGMEDGVNNYRVGLGRLWDLRVEGEPVDLEGHT